MSDVISQADRPTGRVAAIYARVSSERQRQDETIQEPDRRAAPPARLYFHRAHRTRWRSMRWQSGVTASG
jgi:hypothetical protein